MAEAPFKVGDKLLLVDKGHPDYNNAWAFTVREPMTVRAIEWHGARPYVSFREAHPNILAGGGSDFYWLWSVYTAHQVGCFKLIPQTLTCAKDIEDMYG